MRERFNMLRNENLMIIEYEVTYAGIHKIPMIAMYNGTRIAEETVVDMIQTGEVEHSDFVVTMFKSQYDNLHSIQPISSDFYDDLNMEQKEQM